MKQGDTFTVKGVKALNGAMPNPDRKWWQVWKPRMVSRPAVFVVVG